MCVMILVASAVLAAGMAVVAGRRHRELQAWALGLTVQAVSYILLALRGRIPDFVSIVLSNAGISATLALYALGVYRIHREPVPYRLVFGPVAVTAAVFAALMNDLAARLLAGSLIWLSQTLFLMSVVWRFRGQTPGVGQYVVLFAAGVFAVAEVVRMSSVLLGEMPGQTLTTPSVQAIGFFLSSLSCTTLLAVGALTMVQERAEEALARSEALHRKVIESASVGVCVISKRRVRLINPKGADLLGFPASDIVGQPLSRFIAAEDLEMALHNHQLRLAGKGDDLCYQLRMLGPSGAVRWMEVSGVALDWHGQPATLNFLSDVTERHESEAQMRELALHDSLTQLANRRLFLDHLELALASSDRSGRCGAVLFLDLDNFKPLNDRHGHAVGDLLLREVASRLERCVRPSDTVARLGGDEFVVLLTDLAADPGLAAAQAQQKGGVIREALAEPYHLRAVHDGVSMQVTHHCTATGGIAMFQGARLSVEDLLDSADAAMYAAKEAGRNRICLAGAGPEGFSVAHGEPMSSQDVGNSRAMPPRTG